MSVTASKSKNIAILASGYGSTAEHIIQYAKQNPLCAYHIKLIISDNNDAYVLTRAKNHHIPHAHITPSSNIDDDIMALLHEHAIDYVILAGYMRLISPLFCHKWAQKIINIHPSILPKYKGLNTYKRALDDYAIHANTHHGTSIHLVNEFLDGGAIIMQAIFAISDDDDEASLADKTKKIEGQLYPAMINDLCQNALHISDNSQGASLVTWYNKPTPITITW